MSFMLYLFKKDIVRLRSTLTVWLLLIAMQSGVAIGGTRLAAENFMLNILMPQVTLLIGFLQGIMIIVMVPMIVQGDSLVGTTAFWFTRPISRRRLLIAKAEMILGALIILPLLAELSVLAIHGVASRYIFLAIPEILLEKAAFVLPFLILASLTQKFSRYARTGAVLFVGAVIISIVASFAGIFFHVSLGNLEMYQNASLAASSKVVKQIAIILLGSCLVSYQFLTRKTERTIGLLVASFIFLSFVTKMWGWDFLKYAPSGKELSLAQDTLSVDFDFDHVIVAEEFRVRKSGARRKSISLKQTVTGLPPGQFAILKNLRHPRVKYPDGRVVKSGYISTRAARRAPLEYRLMAPIQAALKDVTLINPVKDSFSLTEAFSVDTPDFKRYKDKVGVYSADAEFDIYEYEVSSSVPLKQGAGSSFGSEQILIDDILKDSNRISVVVIEKKVNLLFDRTIEKTSRFDIFENMFSSFKDSYLLVNKARSEALLAESRDSMINPSMSVFALRRLQTNAIQVDFILINDQGDILTEIDKGWLEDAELLRLGAKKVGTIETGITVEDFFIPSESTEKTTKRDELNQQLRMQQKQMEEQFPEMQQK